MATNRFRIDDFWEVTLPSGWVYLQQETSVAFFNENGVGAITASAFKRHPSSSPLPAIQVLKEFVRCDDIVHAPVETSADNFTAAEVDYVDAKNQYWRVSAYVAQHRALVLSYNSAAEEKLIERDDVEAIIKSVYVCM